MMVYRVMFCCNDDRGNFAGRVEEIEVGDLVRIVAVNAPTFRVLPRDQIKIGRRYYATRGEWSEWVGNIFWNSVSMREEEALRLVRELLANGWAVEEWAEEGPFAEIAKAAS